MKIGNDITAKKTAGLNAKDSEEFEKFVQERKKKRMKEQQEEEKITHKMPDKEGEPSDEDLANQTREIISEKAEFDARHDVQLDDIEKDSDESDDGDKS